MITDKRYAELALLAYDNPTHEVGNAAMHMCVEDMHTVISIAGTNDGKDVRQDLRMIPWRPDLLDGRWVHLGFWQYFMLLWPEMRAEILVNHLPVRFIGHSLGGTAAYYGAALVTLKQYARVDNVTTFGTPRCMSPAMSKLIRHIEGKRFRHDGDPIPFGGLYGYDRQEQTLLCGNTDGLDHPLQNYIDAISQLCEC